jgi:uncharacterized protein Smg (DUF494 family)
MEERILEIVFYLVEHVRNHNGQIGPFRTISKDLKSRGFTDSEISSAYSWFLEELQRDGGRIQPVEKSPASVRVLSPQEMQHFTPEAAGLLLQLFRFRLVSAAQFERIVDKSMMLGGEIIDLAVMKVIAARYVFSSGTAVDLNWFNVDGSETIN